AKDLVDAVAEGRIAPPVWTACAQLLLVPASGPFADALAGRALDAAAALLDDARVDGSAPLRTRLEALASVYAERTAGAATAAGVRA
ncbi:hypothetical protein ABTM71_19680, partial [Acinetobacter baumannii]